MNNHATLGSRAFAAPSAHFELNRPTTGPSPRGETVLACRQIYKSYRRGRVAVPVLKGVDLEIAQGSMTAIVGKSGSGKSTLLHLLGTLDRPDSGETWYFNERADRWSVRRKDRFRNREIGMIFQFYHLLPELTTLENVLVPRMIQNSWLAYRLNKRSYVRRGQELLEIVGLSHRMGHKPNQLSGGEMQRAAIARALIAEPSILLADEPTGNLDGDTGREILQILMRLRQERKLTIVMVTHDDNIAQLADRIVQMVDGKVQVRNLPRVAVAV